MERSQSYKLKFLCYLCVGGGGVYLYEKISSFDNFIYKYYREVHCVRMAIAFALTFIFLHYFSLTNDNWILVTMITVIGPISYLGNVISRALDRSLGTVIGAISGFIALYIECYSFAFMLCWCAVVMLICGYFSQGGRPYMGLLIGITLCVVIGAPPGDFNDAIIRSVEAITGSVLALVFTSIYPQRAFIRWRILVSDIFLDMIKIQRNYTSPIVCNCSLLNFDDRGLRSKIENISVVMKPANLEVHVGDTLFNSIYNHIKNIFIIFELLNKIYNPEVSKKINTRTLEQVNKIQEEVFKEMMNISHIMLNGGSEVRREIGCTPNESKSWLNGIKNESNLSIVNCGYIWLSLELLEELRVLALTIENSFRK